MQAAMPPALLTAGAGRRIAAGCLGASLLLVAASAAAGDDAPAPPERQGAADRVRNTARSSAEWLARTVDSWFGDRPFSDGGQVSDGRLDVSVLYRADQGSDFGLRFTARFRLPNLSEHTHLFLGSDNEQEQIADTPAPFTRQGRLQPTARSEQAFFAGLGYDWRRGLDLRIGVTKGVTPYAQVRFRHRWELSPRSTAEFRETLFWRLGDQWGSTTAASYSHAPSPAMTLYWLGAATITQRSRHFDWSSELGLVRALEAQRRVALEALMSGRSGSGIAVSDWGLRVRWEQPLHRDWLRGELIAGRSWARADTAQPRRGVWVLGFGMKMAF